LQDFLEGEMREEQRIEEQLRVVEEVFDHALMQVASIACSTEMSAKALVKAVSERFVQVHAERSNVQLTCKRIKRSKTTVYNLLNSMQLDAPNKLLASMENCLFVEKVFNAIYLSTQPITLAELELKLSADRGKLQQAIDNISKTYLDVDYKKKLATYVVKPGIKALNHGYPNGCTEALALRMSFGLMISGRARESESFTTRFELNNAGAEWLYEKFCDYNSKLPVETALDNHFDKSRDAGHDTADDTFGVCLYLSPTGAYDGALSHAQHCSSNFLDKHHQIVPFRYSLSSASINEMQTKDLGECFNELKELIAEARTVREKGNSRGKSQKALRMTLVSACL
jgi:hypothetical protein